MKKIILTLLIALLIGLLPIFAGCNKQIIDLNLKFTNAYVKIGENWIDLKISTWADYEGEQIQLKLVDGTVLIVHSANCILYKGELPVLKEVE